MLFSNHPLSHTLVTLIACQALVALASADYVSNARTAANTLVSNFYNDNTGLFSGMWWNSANMITTLADLTIVDNSLDNLTANVFTNTFNNAQKQSKRLKRSIYSDHVLNSPVTERCVAPNCPANAAITETATGWLNEFYDDEGWWALAWLRVHDLTGQNTWLSGSIDIFNDMVSTGYNATCGGLYWKKDKKSNNAIENELFLALAAGLANRIPEQKEYYQEWAVNHWNWFNSTGLINSNNNIVDGLNITTCKPEGAMFTYNQGVIVGGLIELYKLTSTEAYLDKACAIADAGIKLHTNTDGILQEVGEANGQVPGGDGIQFKGVFMRNVYYLWDQTRETKYSDFFKKNANSIWNNARNGSLLGPEYTGPYATADARSQSSALDALVGAAAVSV